MFRQMFVSEWLFFTKQPSFYASSLIFFSIAMFTTGFEKLINDFGSNIHINGPFFISQIIAMFSIFALFLVVNFIGNTALKDYSSNMAELLYCKPFNPLEYQLGRFFGAFTAVVAVFSMAPVGLFVGSLMPWVTQEHLGDYNLSHYLNALLFLAIPTLFVFSCLFYVIAVRLKSMMAIYLSVIAVFVLYGASESMFMSHQDIAALLDPFAERTFAEISRYWTVFEKNNQPLTLDGLLLLNRAIWMALALLVMFSLAGIKQPLSINTNEKRSKKGTKNTIENQNNSLLINKIDYLGQNNVFWPQLFTQIFFEIKQVIFTRAFIILCSAVFLMMVAVLLEPKGMFNTRQLPYTQIMVQVIKGAMKLLSLIIITYYCAEIIWRERQSGIGEIIDAMPVANLSFWLSKLIAVWSVILLLLGFSIIVTIIFQLAYGFEHLDLTQYFVGLLYFSALPWMMLTVLAFFLQIISPNKYVGMFLFVLFLISDFAMEPLGLGHNMLRFTHSPALTYTDLNGFGWSLQSQFWYMLYWGAVSFALCIIGYGLWQRGPVNSLQHRIQQLSYQIGQKGKAYLAISAIAFTISGSVIYYNTTVLNEYQTQTETSAQKATYESSFSQYENAAIPVIQKLDVNVEFYPQERKVIAKAEIEVINKTNSPIKRFLVSLPYYTAKEFSFEITGGNLHQEKHVLNSQWFEFEQAIQPGEKRKGSFRIVRKHTGFPDSNEGQHAVDIVENGSFFEGAAMFPLFGYRSELQLIDPTQRKKFNLGSSLRVAKLEDVNYYAQSSQGPDISFIDFTATVSTSADQTAIAPGTLIKQWQKAGRNYFRYESEGPMEYFVAFMSGRYQLISEQHNGVDVEIYYHQQHDQNVQRMQQAVKDSLDYFSESFGAYPHSHARVIEFPGYANFAQSFPNTIAFSERIGFITDLRNPDELDKIYYVIAHEMAHQWWGNQVVSANVQGSTMLVETLAQYSALMLFKKKYGETKLRRVLKLELDKYLRGRSNEIIAELPLMRVENQQYVHYNKGSVVMMALVDRIGESRMNRVLKAFVAKYQYKDSPYPTSSDLLTMIKQEASPEEQNFIHSLFATITLYDLKMKSLFIEQLPSGEFSVDLVIDAHRIQADAVGDESEVELSELIDIGLFLQDPNDTSGMQEQAVPLYLQKHLIKSGKNKINLIVSEKPLFAGIDPFIKLIDRNSDDNVIKH